MKAVEAAFNQEKALVGAFSVITNLRIEFEWNFLKHIQLPPTLPIMQHWLHRYVQQQPAALIRQQTNTDTRYNAQDSISDSISG